MHLSPHILKTYLRRLTNLSIRNRSLLLSNLPQEQFMDWQSLDFVGDKSAFELLKEVLSQKKAIKLCQKLDPRAEKVNEISKKLSKISRTERFIEDERGSEDLYVGYPFVRGKLTDGTPIHGPLAFFPVTLRLTEPTSEKGVVYWELHRRSEPASLNRSFLLAYAHFNQIKLPDELLEANLDELSRDPLQFRTDLYELLKNSPLALNFNQDLFQDHLQFFETLTKADLDLLERNGELKLYPEAVLGIFPQAGSYLGPDYEALIGQGVVGEEGIEEGLPIFQPSNAAFSPVEEAKTFTAFVQDASQEAALGQVKQGASLVVQGPPGTGKSQLIANLMSDFTARGKRVLLVCQKRVALDVVYQRLAQVGMAPFVALIHDFKNDRAALYQQLDQQIEQVEAYQKQNYSLDAIFLERQFLQVSRSIEQLTRQLDTFRNALYDETEAGVAPKELYLSSNPQEPHFALATFKTFRFDEKLEPLLQKFRRLGQYQAHITPSHPWYQRQSLSRADLGTLSTYQQILSEIPLWATQLQQQLSAFAPQYGDVAALLSLQQQHHELKDLAYAVSQEEVWPFFEKYLRGFFDSTTTRWYRDLSETVGRLQASKLLGDEVQSAQLQRFDARLEALIAARQSVVKWLFYGDKDYFKTLTKNYGLSLEIKDLYQLQQILQNRQEWEATLRELSERLGIRLVGDLPSVTEQHWQRLVAHLAIAQQAYTTLTQHFTPLLSWANSATSSANFVKTITQLLDLAQQNALKYTHWRQWLTHEQILSYQNPTTATTAARALNDDFDVLVGYDVLQDSLTDTEKQIVAQYNSQPYENSLADVFLNSLQLAWLGYLEDKNPLLRAASSLEISQLEEELQSAITQKQALSQAILGMQLREQTYLDLTFNRLQHRVSYRELQHQVTKKRKIWPVRKLMEQHADEVFKLVPCWLASPETVSAVFPLTTALFDLVVFDEASQCYAEYGIPAMFRGRQVVVVGDSKQLAPYDLYRVRYEADNDAELPELEVESLLDLAKRFLLETTLQGHYRSKSLDLIAFSNLHFYRNKLQLLPYFEEINRQTPAIRYHKVEGIWENNRNEVEAQMVVLLWQKFRDTQPDKSVGIVTFNHPQQQLIEQYLWEQNQEMLFSAPLGGWGVKNIENVQGDECDILIFSVGYAPDLRGKVRVQFGSLNQRNGENRLNVAVTRAREEVHIVTSIWPQQLHVEETVHAGPKLLKDYLQYALNVSEGHFAPQPLSDASFPQAWSLKQKLTQHLTEPHKTVQEELPFADLTIKQGNTYAGLILTDDNLYKQALSAKEAHAYWPLQLKAKQWPFERVWSRQWWRKKNRGL